ncbi:MAG: HDOD domain-containing protein [Sterolibacterium sp.]|nr:HDOD domain-containing protein [Sterolibacterium sp.]
MTSEDAHEPPSLDAILEQTLKDIGIPPRPDIIERIAVEMHKDDPDFRHLSHLVGSDVSLAASLIKTANSPFFGLRNRVHSPNEALMMLGLDVAGRAIAGISLRKAFPAGIRLERFWHASAQIAALSGWLAHTIRKGNLRADDAHAYGLFRDCGIPVMLRRFPAYEKILACANDEAVQQFTEVEQQGLPEFPTDHAMVGCLLAQNWWLPEEICLAIRHHHELSAIDMIESGLPADSRYLIATGQTAEHILQQLTGGSRTREWSKLGASCLRLLDLTTDELPAIYQEGAEVLKTVE